MQKVISFEQYRRRRRPAWRAWRLVLALVVGVAAALAHQMGAADLAITGLQAPPSLPGAERGQAVAESFGLCGAPPHRDCVIDGDTFYLGRQSIRIADIDTPETRGARCDYEATLGDRATHRLHALLNAGPFQLQAGARDADRYGRKLRTVIRDGRSLGDVLVTEGLARPWTGRRLPWCSS
jgi:endonuclease YncB( thermonuclease family)